MIVNLIANPNAALNLIHAQQQHITAMQGGRCDAAMEAAHRKYGKDFERAYEAVATLDPNNPVARSIVMGIVNDQDPGCALMDWYEQTRRPPASAVHGRLPWPWCRQPSLQQALLA
jgi:hypothetical protein